MAQCRRSDQSDADGAEPAADSAAGWRPHRGEPAAAVAGGISYARTGAATDSCWSSSFWLPACSVPLMQPLLRRRPGRRAPHRRRSETFDMFADRVLSGMRPTGRMHLGHYHGALKNWVRLQEEYECLYFAADWHALTTHYETPERIEDSVWDMFVDWLAVGINPTRATIFIQSRVIEHAELALAARHDHAGRLARARADVQGSAGKALRSRPVDLRLPRLSGDAGRRHPDLSRQHGSGRRGPGLAPRAGARACAPLQPHLRPRARLRGQGQGGDQEARLAAAPSATTSCAPRSRSRATRRRCRRRATCSTRRRTSPSATASACSAISKARAA